MFTLAISDVELLLRSVTAAFPREACGALLRQDTEFGTVLSLRITTHEDNTPASFVIRSATLRNIETSLRGTDKRIGGCWHSHVIGRAWPSRRDSAGATSAGELWLIYSLTGQNLRLFEWDGAAFQRRALRVVKRVPTYRTSSTARVTKDDCDHGCSDCAECLEKRARRIAAKATSAAAKEDVATLP